MGKEIQYWEYIDSGDILITLAALLCPCKWRANSPCLSYGVNVGDDVILTDTAVEYFYRKFQLTSWLTDCCNFSFHSFVKEVSQGLK